jgi:hypothetical protein
VNANSQCVILVPCTDTIVSACESSLRILEERGYVVRRIRGFSQIDVARNCIASDALRDGFIETIWIDSDIGFHPDDVERLRSHKLPIVCGIYPKKGKRQLTCKFLPETTSVHFGAGGGLLQILYAATGFLYVHRDAYLQIQSHLKLPVCNQAFGESVVPWFQPLVRDIAEVTGIWAKISPSANEPGCPASLSTPTPPFASSTTAITPSVGKNPAAIRTDLIRTR